MAVTILEFGDVSTGNDDPVYPAQRRRESLALDTFIPIGDVGLVRGVLIYNDSPTTGIHVRISGDNSASSAANQKDPFIGPDGNGYFLIQRKDRANANNKVYLYATADT